MSVTPKPLLLYAAIAAALLLAVWLGRIYWRRKLTKWAQDQGFRLVHYRSAWFYEGPSAWRRSRSQHAFRVVVEDKNGLHRTCWILFGTFWGFTFGEPVTKVEWDDDTDN